MLPRSADKEDFVVELGRAMQSPGPDGPASFRFGAPPRQDRSGSGPGPSRAAHSTRRYFAVLSAHEPQAGMLVREIRSERHRRMLAPTDRVRESVARTTEDWAKSDLSDDRQEAYLERLLEDLERQMFESGEAAAIHVELTRDDAEEQLSAIDAWAGLVSHAVARVYAPASPWPRRRAGWAQGVVRRLRRIAEIFRTLLAPVASALQAIHFSVSVAFPWGIAIGFAF